MKTMTISFKNEEDKKTLQRVINALEMDVTIDHNESMVSESVYKEIKEDHEQYLRGELETYPWEEVKSELKKKYGV